MYGSRNYNHQTRNHKTISICNSRVGESAASSHSLPTTNRQTDRRVDKWRETLARHQHCSVTTGALQFTETRLDGFWFGIWNGSFILFLQIPKNLVTQRQSCRTNWKVWLSKYDILVGAITEWKQQWEITGSLYDRTKESRRLKKETFRWSVIYFLSLN